MSNEIQTNHTQMYRRLSMQGIFGEFAAYVCFCCGVEDARRRNMKKNSLSVSTRLFSVSTTRPRIPRRVWNPGGNKYRVVPEPEMPINNRQETWCSS